MPKSKEMFTCLQYLHLQRFRSDCFNNRFFLGCMDVMMVSKRTRSKAASFVSMINTYSSYTSR